MRMTLEAGKIWTRERASHLRLFVFPSVCELSPRLMKTLTRMTIIVGRGQSAINRCAWVSERLSVIRDHASLVCVCVCQGEVRNCVCVLCV